MRRYDTPGGSGMHAEVRLDDTVIMLGDGGDSFNRMQPTLGYDPEE